MNWRRRFLKRRVRKSNLRIPKGMFHVKHGGSGDPGPVLARPALQGLVDEVQEGIQGGNSLGKTSPCQIKSCEGLAPSLTVRRVWGEMEDCQAPGAQERPQYSFLFRAFQHGCEGALVIRSPERVQARWRTFRGKGIQSGIPMWQPVGGGGGRKLGSAEQAQETVVQTRSVEGRSAVREVQQEPALG